MPFSSGTYSAPSSPGAFNPAVGGQQATPAAWNALLADLSTALSTAILKDGTQTVTADIPFGGHKLTGVANGTAATDAPNLRQLASQTISGVDDTGTVNSFVLTPAIPVTAYAPYQVFRFKALNSNTGASQINVSGLGTKPIKHSLVNSDLLTGDIIAGEIAEVIYDGTNFQLMSASGMRGTASTWRAAQTFNAATNFGGLMTLTGAAFNQAARVDVASAATTDIGAAISNYVRITGTTTITSLGAIASGAWRAVVFNGVLTLTNNASSLILPNGGANIVTAIGDTALFVSGDSGWRCLNYSRLDGTSLQMGVGTQVDRAYATQNNYITVTARLPADNSIPQVSEGQEILSAVITPKSATNRVRATVTVPIGFASGSTGLAGAALFRTGSTDALDCNFIHPVDGNGMYPCPMVFEDSPGSISVQTYTVRVGGNTADIVINGDSTGRLGGGSSRATLVLEEIVA